MTETVLAEIMKGERHMNATTAQAEIKNFLDFLRPNLKKALSLSDVLHVSFPSDSGKPIYTERATVTFSLPNFITTENNERELTLVFDFDKLTKNGRE